MTTDGLTSPAADAPSSPWLRQVVAVGDLVAVSGQVARDWETGENFVNSVAQQTAFILERISQLLASVGSSMEDVITVTAYLTDFGRFTEFNEAYRLYFPTDPPTRTAVEVSALAHPYAVEISALAVRRPHDRKS